MKQFICLDLLNTFTPKELKGLKDLLSCRYFNTDKCVEELLHSLSKNVLGKDDFTSKMQIKVYHDICEGSSFNDGGLEKEQKNYLNAKMSILTRLTEQFLVIENIKNDELQKHDLLYDTLLERRQIRLFEKRMKTDDKTLDKQEKKDELYHFRKYSIEKKRLDCLHQTGQLVTEDNLPEIVTQLDTYYLLNKLSLYNTALSLQYVSSKKQYDWDRFKVGITALMELPQYAEHPIAELFDTCIKLLEMRDNNAYLKLLRLLDEHTERVPTYLLKSFYATANVYCVGQIVAGYLEYSEKMFDLYKIMHEKNLFIEDNFIQIGEIKNMITVACRVEKYEWAREVLNHYKKFIRMEVRKSVYHFNLGAIAFYQKDYETAHDKFIQVDRIDTTYDINTRVLILKCLYEKETEYNEYTMTAFRSAGRFFKNHQSITPKSKRGYKNFIQILIALYRFCHNVNQTQANIERIKNKLNAQSVNIDKRWLLQKISELENN